MNKEKLFKALCIDDSFTTENLKLLKEQYFNIEEEEKYSNLMELFCILERDGIKSESLIELISNIKEENSANNKLSIFDMEDKFKNEKILNRNDFGVGDNEETTVFFQILYLKTRIYDIANNIKKYKTLIKEKERSPYSYELGPEVKEERLKNVLYLIRCIFFDFPLAESFLSEFKRNFVSSIKYTIENKLFNDDSLLIFKTYGQIALFLLNYEREKNDINDNYVAHEKEAISYIAYLIGDYLYSKNEHVTKECRFFAEKGIGLNRPLERSRAFNNLGVIAIDLREYQLANDVYVSWLNQEIIGDMKEIVSNSFTWSLEEEQWRKTEAGEKMTSVIYSNLSYVCIEISDTYEYDAEQGRIFFELATEYVIKAMKFNHANDAACSTYGYILSAGMNCNMSNREELQKRVIKLKEAIQYDCDYKSKTHVIERKLAKSRSICQTRMEMIALTAIQLKGDLWANDTLEKYYTDLKKEINNYLLIKIEDENESNKELSYEIRRRNELMPLFSFILDYENDSESLWKIIILIISIRMNIKLLREYLHRREYISTKYYTRRKDGEQNRDGNKEIAYYTTLRNISHIFEELVLREDGKATRKKEEEKDVDSKNCLTVMNAKYMNDPSEGKVIIEELMKQPDGDFIFSKKPIEDVVDNIFKEKFVFLKSFTEQIDKLTMWNRYANDYGSDGNNSNGCCVLVDPACFANKLEYSKSGFIFYGEEFSDNYNLYRIVYISSDGSIDERKNPRIHKNVSVLYYNLKKQFVEINKLMKKIFTTLPEEKAEEIRISSEKLLLDSLTSIMFLFKNDDYSDEHESRLILYRDRDHQSDIFIFPAQDSGDIPKLGLKPYFQILINGVILGPNVRNTEKWKPYFQYQLNNMWDNHTVSGVDKDDKDNYFIKNSGIKYLT